MVGDPRTVNATTTSEVASKNKKPLISVAMPVYNGEQYLAEAIESILSQTFSDFELIIIDDGSTDNSLRVLQHYQQTDARVKLKSRSNKGFSNTVNEIIDLATGKWLARMDQDDIAMPHRFERQLQFLENSGADICGSWVQLFGTDDKRVLKHALTDAAIRVELLFGSSFAHPAVMMRTESIREMRYNPAWDKAEDYELWVRAACAGWKMLNIPEVLLMYRQHGAQISSVSALKQQQLTQKIRFLYWTHTFNLMKLNQKWIEEVLKLRDPLSPKPDMNDVDLAFSELLKSTKGEAREVIFEHATRLYFRAAATCSDSAKRWGVLNKNFGNGYGLRIKAQLFALSIFHIKADSKSFKFLKKVIKL